jgi:hypothetical protein
MIEVDWGTKTITVPLSFLTLVVGDGTNGSLFELDVNALRLALKNLEDDADGMAYPDTHRHNTEVVLSGVTYARTFEVINDYVIKFEDTDPNIYGVRCVGANHNIADVKVVDCVSLIVGNSAGLVVTENTDLSPIKRNTDLIPALL